MELLEIYAHDDYHVLRVRLVEGGDIVRYTYRSDDPYAPAELRELVEARIAEGDIPPLTDDMLPDPEPVQPHVRERMAVINSFTDEQFELWDERFPPAPARQRVTWNNGSTFTSTDDAWPTVQALFVHVFGEEVGKGFFPDHPTA
ncbi:hypothetical protein [Aureimonas mangrovi]|uniref:hypothetical protein n=1 Tax=Aureimonas mangrovi TaxID=2758041 RepID=UPI00163DDD27|nr:hypothetical protein [Aureimonas mangrovi]